MATTTYATRAPHALREDDKTYLDPQSDQDLLSTARSRWNDTLEATRDDKDQQAAAARFLAGEQWSAAALAARNGPGQVARPAFVIPLQSVYCKQVVAAWRQSPQAMRIRPKSGQASQDTAQVLEGLVRNIEQESQALIAYSVALEHAVSTGEGFFRLNLAYADPYSFRQTIKIDPVPNRFSVYLDPAAQHPCGLDAEYGFVIDAMSWSRFCSSTILTLASWNCGIFRTAKIARTGLRTSVCRLPNTSTACGKTSTSASCPRARSCAKHICLRTPKWCRSAPRASPPCTGPS